MPFLNVRKPVQRLDRSGFAQLVKRIPPCGSALADMLDEHWVWHLAFTQNDIKIPCRHPEMPRSFDALDLPRGHGRRDVALRGRYRCGNRHPAEEKAEDAEQLHG
ncbi:MAG: hypothetical protein BGO06_09075 [Shinella sp. 65-6]|nr:MAG: hypothetical protein BGO06_09075 [Shinella sp. 65-6]